MPFSSRFLLRPLPDISLATWNLAPLSQHHCIKDMLPMKIYPYLSYRREINGTDVNYTFKMQKVWDSSYSLNGNSCSLLILIRSTIPMISGDFLLNTMECDHTQGEGKRTILRNFIFFDRSLS